MPAETMHFRDLPPEPTEDEILALWTEQTDADREAIRQHFKEEQAAARQEARARLIAETTTVSMRAPAPDFHFQQEEACA